MYFRQNCLQALQTLQIVWQCYRKTINQLMFKLLKALGSFLISVPTFLGLLRDLTSQLGSKLASFQVLQ